REAKSASDGFGDRPGRDGLFGDVAVDAEIPVESCPREARPRPSTIRSSGRTPTPRPRVSRPPEMASIAAVSLASSTGGHTGPSRMLLMRPMAVVVAAAAAKATVSISPGYAMRPTVASVEKPACSLVVPASGQGTKVYQLLRGRKQFHQFTVAQGADQHCAPMA